MVNADGAPALRLVTVKEYLVEVFNNYAVTIQHQIERPPQSADLTPCNFIRELRKTLSICHTTTDYYCFLLKNFVGA